jgi:prevent-host-death family protein
MEVIGIEKARAKLGELVEKAQVAPVLLTRNGEAGAVLVNAEDYESLLATIELLSNPEYHRQMAVYQTEVAAGNAEYVSQDEVERQIAARRQHPQDG